MGEFFLNLIFGWVPWWAWAALALLALGGIYRWVGMQGVVALGFGIAAFFGYRQGWRDRGENKPPAVPIEDIKVVPLPPPPRRKKRRTLMDILNGR